jgi:hypothetical protein
MSYPDLSSLTEPRASKRPRQDEQGDRNILRDLPPDLQKQVLELANDGTGVPLLLVRSILYRYGPEPDTPPRRNENIFYVRLPDPTKGLLDADRFYHENYPYAEIFEGIVDLAGYDATTTKARFLKVVDGDIPNALVLRVYDGYEPNVLNVVRDAVDEIRGVPVDAPLGEQLLFATFPTFKSHVAIVLTTVAYD